MLKKTVTYKDFNDIERTEDFYFNLTEAELMETELGITGGYTEMIKKIVQKQEQPAIISIFKEMVLKAYGIKSADGRQFMKSDEIRAGFACSAAYSKIFMELATDADAGAKFVNGIMPPEVSKKMAENPGALEVLK